MVITIVILIILATISINAVVGENGLIQSAKNSKDSAENAVDRETGKMNTLLTEYANIMSEDAGVTEPGDGGGSNPGGGSEPEEPETGNAIDGTLAVGPQLSDGMTPVKYVNGIGWVKTTETDTGWYNYSEKQWANIVLGDATFNTSGSYEVLDETKTYSMLVWIPRYAYKIASGYHQSSAGNISIVFLDTLNKDKDGVDYGSKTKYPTVTNNAMDDYVIHPAFLWDGVALAGFWTGKYETSNNGNKIQIKGGVQSWGRQVGDIHNICIGMNNSGNSYDLNSADSKVDPHMIKNIEWGAVAYLSQSVYGIYADKKGIEENSSNYTGGGNSITSYRINVGQSTTGNVTGVYDMSGGAGEFVAAYYNSSDASEDGGASLVNADARYKDVYSSYRAPTSGGTFGDAMWETSSGDSGSSWYGALAHFPSTGNPFFVRGGTNYYGAGIFSYMFHNLADYNSVLAFRVVIPVIQ